MMRVPVIHPARRFRVATAALAASLALVLAAAAPSHAANWTCEGSALRGTVLGAATIEPLTANKGQETCKPARAGLAGLFTTLPLPLALSALGAETTVENADQPVDRQRVTAFGGITDLRVRALPELPLRIPLPDLSSVPAVTTPLGTIDLKPAVAALLPDGRLPNVDIVNIQALTARAAGRCENGRAELTGESRVTGLSVLGQELPVNQVVERTVSLVNSQSIDPSNANLDNLQLAPGIVLTNPIKQQLQQVLDALPDIVIPATLATVKITPGQQIRSDERLTQRALQVQVSLLGQQLVDLVIGEASVGTSGGVVCGQTAAESALACTTRRLVLVDVIPGRRRVRLLGYADRRYVGRRVGIYFTANGRRVARPLVRRDGSFRATAAMPSRRVRFTNRARYQARIGRERSMRLKLMRRMRVFSVRTSGRRVTITGRVIPPLSRPLRLIEVRRRVSCDEWRVVKRIRPSRTGRFRTTIAGPPRSQSAAYRFTTKVRASSGGKSRKLFDTYTLPRYVDLG